MEDRRLVPPPTDMGLVESMTMRQAGELANEVAVNNIFTDYRSIKGDRTVKGQDDDLRVFTRFLGLHHVVFAGKLNEDASAWNGVTWGLVDRFIKWQLEECYAVSSINRRLSTIKKYITMAARANMVSADEVLLVQDIHAYTYTNAHNINKTRPAPNRGSKKETPILPTFEQMIALKKKQPDNPQGRRDALLMCMLLDQGLRCGEVVSLTVENFDVPHQTFTVYREKVHKTQTHELTQDTLGALLAYLYAGGPSSGFIWYSTTRYKELAKQSLTTRAINKRVSVLGARVGIPTLSPHDCRHYWATSAVLAGTDIKALQDAGGWNSPAMPLRYVESSKIANERVKLMGQKKG